MEITIKKERCYGGSFLRATIDGVEYAAAIYDSENDADEVLERFSYWVNETYYAGDYLSPMYTSPLLDYRGVQK